MTEEITKPQNEVDANNPQPMPDVENSDQNNSIPYEKLTQILSQASEQFNTKLEQYYSPTDDLATTLRKDDMVEKLTAIQENLSMVAVYSDLKSKGISEIEIPQNNEKTSIPLEALLAEKEELLEIVQQPDFSLKNQQSMESIIDYSLSNSEYNAEFLASIKTRSPITDMTTEPVQNASNFEEKTAEFIQNLPIANNTTIDLSAHTEQIEPTSTENAQKQADRLIQRIQKQINTPCDNIDSSMMLTLGTYVGNLDAKNILGSIHEAKADENLSFDKPHQQLKKNDIEYVDENGALAYQLNGKIFINTKTYTPEEIEATKQKYIERGTERPTLDSEFDKGNKIAQLVVALHEACHLTHEKKVNIQSAQDNPINILKSNTLTEKAAYATEFLSIANMHANLKKQGVKTLVYTDNDGLKEMPLDKLLDFYPGLREAVKDGFSATNPKDVRKVVEISSKQWDERMSETYKKQAIRAAVGAAKRMPSFSAQVDMYKNPQNLDPEKKYQKDSQLMLKDVYIGGNVSVDLTHCKDLLDTGKPEEILNLGKENEAPEANIILTYSAEAKKEQMLPKETVLKLNDYLEQQGIKTSKEKDEYVQTAFKAIVTRSSEASKYEDFKNLLLENGGTIQYADGLTETHNPDTKTITYKSPQENGFTLVVPDENNTKTNVNEQQLAKEQPEQNKTLTPQQMAMLAHQQSR